MKYPIPEPLEQVHRPRGAFRARPRSKGHYVQHCNVVYAEADGAGLVMDVFEPAENANGRAIVDVIAGAWHADRARLNEHIGLGAIDAFCDAGFTVFAVAPGSAHLFTAARMAAHVHAAIRHIRENAGAWNIDPARLGIFGVSAGGHIAALTALSPQPPEPKSRLPWYRHGTGVAAVGLFFPPTDLLDYGGQPFDFGRDSALPITRMLFEDGIHGHTKKEIREAARAISPLHQIPKDPPPFLLAHATDDAVVPYSQSERFVKSLKEAGADAALITHRGEGHPWRGIAKECGAMAAWFADRLAG
ncbi:MAG: prolyl oligopeptidase family serine peptidase [Candidatus Hydrogenedentes bacterium]|nr:prolyl oligopeptidase family serine peptidase [Candidatus Hydrogenedentota bacterium]